VTWSHFFPSLMIALSAGASIVYGLAGDWRRTLYWAAAVVITTVVTF
jgi:hypothetical protein